MELPSRVGGRCGWRTGCSIWSGTGNKRSWFASSCSAVSLRRPPRSTFHGCRQPCSRLFDHEGLGADEADRQQLAAAVSALGRVSVLAGGPGTGKTTTVARLLALLRDQPGPELRIALAAPTGKAAARLEEAVRAATAELSPR